MKLAKLWQIDVYMHFSTLIILGYLGYESAVLYRQNFLESRIWILFLFGVLNALITICSVIIHEFAHALTAKSFGLEIKEVELNVLGGATKINRDPDTPLKEILMAGLGPLSSLTIGGVFFGLSFLFTNSFGKGLFYYVGIMNLGLGFFNLIPSFPLDGGRVFRAILWKGTGDYYKGTQIAARVGTVLSTLLMGLGIIWIVITGEVLNGLWFAFIGWVIQKGAKQSFQISRTQQTLSMISLKSLLHPIAPQISGDIIIKNAVDQYFNAYHNRLIVIAQNNQPAGFFHIDQVEKIDFEVRSTGELKDFFIPLERIQHLSIDKTAKDMVELLRETPHEIDVVAVYNSHEDIMGYVDLYDVELALNIPFQA